METITLRRERYVCARSECSHGAYPLDLKLGLGRGRASPEWAWSWTQSASDRGRPAWDVLLMWKLLIVGKNYGNLSDEMLEECGKINLRVFRFIGCRAGFGPHAKTIHKYRSALAKSGVTDELFEVLAQQLQAHGFQLQKGVMIDASMVSAPK